MVFYVVLQLLIFRIVFIYFNPFFIITIFFFMNKNGYFSVNNNQDPPSKNALLKNTLPKWAFMNTFP